MLKNILSIFIILIVATFCFGQKTKQSQPSVYITYIKTDERIIFDDVKESFAWFRFHNNTKKQIVLQANGGFGEDDARLFYNILDKENNVIEATYCHACSIIRLSSGSSILFSVPLEYFKNSALMRIDYKFDWKGSPFTKEDEQPVHYVHFETPQSLK